MDGSLIQTGTGTLTLNGTLTGSGSNVGPVTPARVTGNLDLGAVPPTGRLIAANDGAGSLDLVIDADISGPAILRRTGGGVLELNGTNTHTGRMVLLDGITFVNGSTGEVGVAGGLLSGNGQQHQLSQARTATKKNGVLLMVADCSQARDQRVSHRRTLAGERRLGCPAPRTRRRSRVLHQKTQWADPPWQEKP